MQKSIKLRDLRKSRGLTLQELAENTGISVGSIGNYETGTRGIGQQSLQKIADFLHVDIREIEEPLIDPHSGQPADRTAEMRAFGEQYATRMQTTEALEKMLDAAREARDWKAAAGLAIILSERDAPQKKGTDANHDT